MKSLILSLLLLMPVSLNAAAKTISVTCGASSGYSYYFEGGLVGADDAGFTKDGISEGKFTLVVNNSDGELSGDVLSVDASQQVKSASSQGGTVLVSGTENSMNWLIFYGDGTLENYAFNFPSSEVAVWRNTAGNDRVAKNSLFISDCTVQ